MRVVLPLIHLDNIVFTPLPQLRLKCALVDAAVCAPEDVIIREYRRDDSLHAMLDDIISLRPDVIGFSCYTWNFLAVERLSAALKAYAAGNGTVLHVVWGGPHISEQPERVLRQYSSVDLVVTWYGEGSFVEIIRQLERGARPSDSALMTPGVFSHSPSESGCNGVKATDYPHIATLGYPYRLDYLPATVTRDIADRVFLVESYRNCPFSCSYCLWGQAQKSYDALSANEMTAQMYHMVADGARIFCYADAGLGLIREDGVQRDLAVFRRYADDRVLQRAGAQIRGYFFWQTLNDDMLDVIADLIKQGVMGQLDIGIQTFNPAVLPDLQRPTDYGKFHAVIERLHNRKIRFSLDLILGLPGDTLDGFKHSLRSVIACRPDRTQSFPLSILPGTAYDLRRDELGIRTIRGSYRDDAETVTATATMPYADMLQALELESWMFLYYAEGLFANGLNALAEETARDPLSVLDSLRNYAEARAPALSSLVRVYREKLYDSRSDGRHLLEQQLMDTFVTVYRELLSWLASEHASGAVRNALRTELLAFPKFRSVAESLDGIDGIQYHGQSSTLTQRGNVFLWQQDPVIGAIVRNRNFYRWSALLDSPLDTPLDEIAVDRSTSDDLVQAARV